MWKRVSFMAVVLAIAAANQDAAAQRLSVDPQPLLTIERYNSAYQGAVPLSVVRLWQDGYVRVSISSSYRHAGEHELFLEPDEIAALFEAVDHLPVPPAPERTSQPAETKAPSAPNREMDRIAGSSDEAVFVLSWQSAAGVEKRELRSNSFTFGAAETDPDAHELAHRLHAFTSRETLERRGIMSAWHSE